MHDDLAQAVELADRQRPQGAHREGLAVDDVLLQHEDRRSDENPRVLYLLMAILRVNIFAIAFLQASVNDVIAQDEMRQVEE